MALTLSGTNKIVNDNLNTEVKTLFTPKNWIINGGFDVWQRGTSATSSNYNTDDRWYNGHSTSTKTTSQQAFTVGQTYVPNNPTYFSRTVVTSGGTSTSRVYKTQNIEDVKKLAGKTVTVSFWAKADSNKNIALHFLQYFGVGGSSDVIINGYKTALTSTWSRITYTTTIPSIAGKTIGEGNCLGLSIYFDAGSDLNARTNSLGNQSGTFDIANVSLVEGSVPVEWQTEAYADVLRQCQRYYVRFGGLASSERFGFSQATNSTTSAEILVHFPVPTRTIPTSLEYSLVLLADGYTGYAISTLTLTANAVSDKIATLSAVSSGLTAYKAYQFYTNSINGYVAFNCEL